MTPTNCHRCGATFPKPPPSGGASGYAVFGGQHICYSCADKQQREELLTAQRFCAYVSSDGHSITTWTGGLLAYVTQSRPCKLSRRSFTHGKSCLSITATDVHGNRWVGRGSPGIAIKIRRVK